MLRFRPVLIVALVAVCGGARAATPIPYDSPRGVMVVQTLHTLGAWVVACSKLPGDLAAADGEVLCAQVPGSMYGFFREAVNGRLYEYLERGTLRVARDWSGAGGNLSVHYGVDGGILSVERERANGVIYAVFRFQSATRAASEPAGGKQSATSAPTAAGTATASAPAAASGH